MLAAKVASFDLKNVKGRGTSFGRVHRSQSFDKTCIFWLRLQMNKRSQDSR